MPALTDRERRLLAALRALVVALPERERGGLRLDRDREAGVSYLSLVHPQRAVDTRDVGEGVWLRYDAQGRLVGITVLDLVGRETGDDAEVD